MTRACLATGALLLLIAGCGDAGRAASPAASDTAVPQLARAPRVAIESAGGQGSGAGIALARVGGRAVAFIADEDDAVIHTLDLETNERIAETPLPGTPGQLVVSREGKLLVAVRDRAQVIAYEAVESAARPLAAAERWPTATEPTGLALSSEGVLVAAGWAGRLQGIRTRTGEKWLDVEVGREPRAIAVASGKAYVGHAIDARVAVVPLTAGDKPAVRYVNLDLPADLGWGFVDERRARNQARQTFSLVTYATGGTDERILVPHTLSWGGAAPMTEGYGDGGEHAVFFEIDPITTQNDEAIALHRKSGRSFEEPRWKGNRCLLPRGAAVDTKRGKVWVTCLCEGTLVEYDAGHFYPGAFPRRRQPVAPGTSEIAYDAAGDRLIAWSAHDHEVSIVPLVDSDRRATQTVVISRQPDSFAAKHAEGRRLFFRPADETIAKDGRACASCHIDGRDDGVVWSTPEGPRQTPMLAGRLERSGPFGWRKQHATIEEHMKTTIANLQGKGLRPEDGRALVAYARAMPGPPVVERPLDAKEAQGKELFMSGAVGCASCHLLGRELSDHEPHDVKSKTIVEPFAAFGTPSLRGVGTSGPYFHDGRYETLEELLTKNGDKMGQTAHLSKDEISALAAYLRTL
jgi:cytochrome c peroxidase